MQNDLLYIMPHPAPQRDRTTIAMIMRGNRSATDNIWPEAARGHLARGRISGQRPCDRPRTVSSKARGPSLLLIVKFVWDYWRLQLIVIRVTDFFLDPCCWRGAQAQTDHLHEEPFFHMAWVQSESSMMVSSQLRVMLRHWVFKHGPQICPHSHHPAGSEYLYHRALIMRVSMTVLPHAPQECGATCSTSIAAAT